MLSGLGAAVLATAVAGRLGWSALSIGFGATAAWTLRSGRLPDAVWVGCLVALVAAWQLVHPESRRAALAAAVPQAVRPGLIMRSYCGWLSSHVGPGG